MVKLFWSFRIVFVVTGFRFGCFACFGGFVSLVSVVSGVSFRSFRGFRFARFGGFVSLVSGVSFRPFRFVVSGFSTCQQSSEPIKTQSKYRSNHDWVWLLVGPMAVLQNQNKCKLLLTLK